MVLAIALLKIAVPFALISCYSTPFELKHALKITKTTRLFAAPQCLSKAAPVLKDLGIPKDHVYVMGSQTDGYGSVEDFVQRAITMNMSHSAARQVPKDTLAFLFFSSGTTGLPKGKRFCLLSF